MFKRTTKLRFRRAFKSRKRRVEDITFTADDRIERHFFRRLNRLSQVRRFVSTWVFFLLLLIGGVVTQNELLANQFLTNKPRSGGTINEGIVGTLTNANPVYATGAADTAVSKLIFSSLFKYNQDGRLIPDLAEKYAVNAKADEFIVSLKKDVLWHDKTVFSADDVIFTYALIQNPDARSPLFTSWQGIIIEKVDQNTVRFKLPNSLGSFPYSLTNGIVPKHKLEKIEISQLRSDPFNTTEPVGTGPFMFSALEVAGTTVEDRRQIVFLEANNDYYIGVPELDNFILSIYPGAEQLITALRSGDIDAATGLEKTPDNLPDSFKFNEYNIPLNGQTMVFFKTSEGVLADVLVRRALVHAANPIEVLKTLPYPALLATSPLLRSHVGYAKDIQQLPYDAATSKKILDDAGWVPDPMREGIRKKGNDHLTFELTTLDTTDFINAAATLKKQWNAIGVEVDVQTKSSEELEQIISPQQHAYQALLYGIAVGNDPDVFVFWHSSQADRRSARLNFSEYKSTVADNALEAGRTRTEPLIRTAKYRPFLEAWRNDAPALGLYQPRYYYIARNSLYGFEAKQLNSAVDHYNNVHKWTILTEKQPTLK